MKRPAFQFYPGDWLRSTDLRSCSVAARGLWMDMLCLMHEGTPYGYLRVGNKDILPPILAKMVGETVENVEIWLKELENSGVFSRKPEKTGCIYSRRMVKDEKVRESRANGGIKSLENPNVPRPRISLPPSLGVSPASASASASASATSNTNTTPPVGEKKVKKTNGFELPDWIPQDHWAAWIEARTKSKKPPTEYAKRLAVRKLDNLREQGFPPSQVLMQSAFNNWPGLYPVKEIK